MSALEQPDHKLDAADLLELVTATPENTEPGDIVCYLGHRYLVEHVYTRSWEHRSDFRVRAIAAACGASAVWRDTCQHIPWRILLPGDDASRQEVHTTSRCNRHGFVLGTIAGRATGYHRPTILLETCQVTKHAEPCECRSARVPEAS